MKTKKQPVNITMMYKTICLLLLAGFLVACDTPQEVPIIDEQTVVDDEMIPDANGQPVVEDELPEVDPSQDEVDQELYEDFITEDEYDIGDVI
ncbi:MAG: hypothetical protein ACMXYF_05600 [Candidatus Woesearchaeota archaeon]